ncbi:N-acetylmuramoyl-L-alanine amidase family protein [Arenibacter echinorum]|uniref:N-acetylmuramoyl-L-alanine amidase n=1 Tax=Arenibacter echinorum TaxID=440515 RepID=A0A327RKC1_9FLAO|nr:N-acetylmuramoyl-L-alanine amidase [Arenibacter echinorum]RAJ16024.1 N-acetylmuramoyl-L-alanine amidase [Arenibacter echinorum]
MNMKRFYIIPFIILTYFLTSFSKDMETDDNDGKLVVVLDAGHGGHDPGNLGNGYLEKNIALKIVLKVGEILERNPNIKVIYTRKDDTFVDLYRRGEIANKANADLFVSVHCDSHSSDAHGAGTFVLGLHANKQNFEIAKKENSVIYLEDNYESRYAAYDINSPESIIGLTIMQEEFLDQSINLAKLMQDNFSNKLKRTDRKVKQAGFIVLHQTFMPSVLVETGFLTNRDEGAYLNSAKGHNEMGKAIADAILTYKGEMISGTDQIAMNETPVVPVPKQEEVKKVAEKSVANTGEKKSEQLVLEQKPVKNIPKTVLVVKNETDNTTKEIAKEPIKKEEPKVVEKEVKAVEKQAKKSENIIFKVQIFASSKNIPLNSENFKGLNTLSKEPYNNLYRYMYGNTDSHFQATLLKSNADAKGYNTSYIVAYKDGVRISETEALKYVSE